LGARRNREAAPHRRHHLGRGRGRKQRRRASAPIQGVEFGARQAVASRGELDLARQQCRVLAQHRRRLHPAGEIAEAALAAAERNRQIEAEAQSYSAYHGLAASRLRFTASIFARPCVASHCSNAPRPCLAYTAMPSFQVARPHSTPANFTPDSAASAKLSVNSALLTPALRKMNGRRAAAAFWRKCSSASALLYAFCPANAAMPSTNLVFTGISTFSTSTPY